jgi:predicted enzyme involved in methoxymalonyl-ACP biosynthesis
VMTLCNRPEWLTRTVSLRDRFGDNGLISVLLAKVQDDAIVIDTWLMSCRVLKRGVESFLHNHLCRWALQQGIHRIQGDYIPTAKNGIVKDHYAALGFARLSEDADGKSSWEFVIQDDWIPLIVQIEEDDVLAGSEATVAFRHLAAQKSSGLAARHARAA